MGLMLANCRQTGDNRVPFAVLSGNTLNGPEVSMIVAVYHRSTIIAPSDAVCGSLSFSNFYRWPESSRRIGFSPKSKTGADKHIRAGFLKADHHILVFVNPDRCLNVASFGITDQTRLYDGPVGFHLMPLHRRPTLTRNRM